MHTSHPASRMPVDPVARRLPDGRAIRVIPLNRHLIVMPPLQFTSWRADLTPEWAVSSFGHVEVVALLERLAQMIRRADCIDELTDLDVIMINDLDTLVPLVMGKVTSGLASRWPSTHLLPIFGNWPTFSELQARFRVRDGRQEVYDAIGWLHGVSASLDLIEARFGERSRRLIGLDGKAE